MENSQYTSNEDSPMTTIQGFETIFTIIRVLTLHITMWLPIVLFVVFWVISIFATLWSGHMKRTLPPFINTIIYDMMYIPAMRSFVSVMVCTYHCTYFGQPDDFKPYPPLDMMPSISCATFPYYLWFLIAIIGVGVHHPLSLNFVAFKKNDSDPAMRLLPRFNVLFYVAKVWQFFFLLILFHAVHIV